MLEREEAFAGGRIWAEVTREHGFEPLTVEGTLPSCLSGTLYRNGPGRFEVSGQRVPHPFDGDGAVDAIRISGGQAHHALRMVNNPSLAVESRLGRPLGGFGLKSDRPLLDLLRRRFRNAANTSVLPWQGRLFALWEAGLPTEVDPENLETLGETDLGIIPETFSAHPHRHPSGSWYNFGIRIGVKNSLDLFEFPVKGPPRRIRSIPIPTSFVHDFALTPHYAVFFLSPLFLSVLDVALGRKSFGDALQWRPDQGTEVLVIPLDGSPVRRMGAEACFQWHFANAFERNDEILVDFVHYPDFETNQYLEHLYRGVAAPEAAGRLCRARIDLHRSTVDFEMLARFSAEFCSVAPGMEGRETGLLVTASHTSLAATRGPLDQVSTMHLQTGEVLHRSFGEGCFVFEPLLAAGSTEEWVLAPVHDAHQEDGYLSVMRAENLEEVARCRFSEAPRTSFHGRWVAGPVA